ncbi:hypothetical protein PsorP6_014963 [Peronosclerospora sorghi]|uniref:Uncharacterized protein n=1 Tax=Peronosclerospora sorghi TaxID=230839 RepID=A0ACC0VS05_9STRA|nr:hypothetical protein PsorP6_014963 [Peronosclerospora sorghi]
MPQPHWRALVILVTCVASLFPLATHGAFADAHASESLTPALDASATVDKAPPTHESRGSLPSFRGLLERLKWNGPDKSKNEQLQRMTTGVAHEVQKNAHGTSKWFERFVKAQVFLVVLLVLIAAFAYIRSKIVWS